MTTAEQEAEAGPPAGRRRGGRRMLVAGGVLVVVAGLTAVALLTASGSVPGRSIPPPWPAPADVEQRVQAAGLTMLPEEGTVLHLHEHLSISIDGRAVTVPAHLGIDEAADRISPIHTHDRTGILHVESPVRRTFRLGQLFTEWDVALAAGRVGGYRDGRDGVRVAMFVDRRPYAGDPRGIVLRERQDLDVVVTTDGSDPAPPAAFAFPSNY